MPRDEFLSTVVKEYGPTAIAKHVLDPNTIITEHELTKALTEACQPAQGQSKAQAFAKLYETDQTVRMAFDMIKNATWAAKAERGMPPRGAPNVGFSVVTLEPRVTGGDAATRSADGTNGDAYSQLMALAAEQRRRAPFMTPEQAFAAVYQDTKNIELVNQERFESRRRGTDKYPGWV